MRNALLILLATPALAAGTAAVSPAVASGPAQADVPEPWATVNLCDTAMRPNQIGIRGSMPGMSRKTRMYMRFRVQYKSDEGAWRTVGKDADSGWRKIAMGRRGDYDAGWTFEFEPRKSGGAWELRGVVSYQWRRANRVVLRDRRFTEEGHPGTAGADPADFSDDTCAIA